MMTERDQGSPMEFEWQNIHGPVDDSSPFMKLVNANSNGSTNVESIAPAQRPLSAREQNRTMTASARKRNFSTFSSPKPKSGSRSTVLTPATSSASFTFRQNLPAASSSPASASGSSSPTSSPSRHIQRHRGPSSSTGSSSRKNPRRRTLVWSGFKNLLISSPKSSTPSKSSHSSSSTRRASHVTLSSTSVPTDQFSSLTPNSSLHAPASTSSHSVSSFFAFLEKHPHLPHILSWYAQLLLNIFLIGSSIYLLYSFWSTIRSDVDKKSEEAVAETLASMAVCAKNYRENRCHPDTRVPAMETICSSWEVCMSRDPRSVGRAKVSAHTFAEIVNSFIEPISWKALVFTIVLFILSLIFSNAIFSVFRQSSPAAPTVLHSDSVPVSRNIVKSSSSMWQ